MGNIVIPVWVNDKEPHGNPNCLGRQHIAWVKISGQAKVVVKSFAQKMVSANGLLLVWGPVVWIPGMPL